MSGSHIQTALSGSHVQATTFGGGYDSLAEVMATLDAAKHTQYINMPLDLHYSDMDHYSIPEWNEMVVRKVRSMGASANAYMYAGNTHEFGTYDGWSPPGSVPGRETAIGRTIDLFNSTP